MTTLILADSHTLAQHNLMPLLRSRPGFAMVAAITGTDDACAQILLHKPDVVIIAGANIDGALCAAVTKIAETETKTRVIYISAYQDQSGVETVPTSRISVILTRENSFEEILSTMMVVLHGGIFISPTRDKKEQHPHKTEEQHGLSIREHEVLKGIASGLTTKQMARSMSLSPKTVETYRNRLMQKLDLRRIADLVQYAVKNDLV